MSNSSIWLIDRTLSGATIPGQSGPGSNGNGGVLRILQSSNITAASPSDCLMSYPGHSLEGGTPLQGCNLCILQPSLTGWHLHRNTVISSVGMLLSPHALKSVNSIERIQPRIMCATFNGNPCTTIVSSNSMP